MSTYERTQAVLPTPQQLFTPGVTAILIALFAGFMFTSFAQAFALDGLALNPQQVIRGRVWQLLTYWMVEPSALALVFNGVVILGVGSAVEREWKTVSFLSLWLVTCGVTALIWVVACLAAGTSIPGTGASSGCFGLIGALGLLFRGQRFFFFLTTVEARVLALILIGIGVILSLRSPIHLIWVLGSLVAFAYITLLWKGGSRARAPRTASASYKPSRFVDVD